MERRCSDVEIIIRPAIKSDMKDVMHMIQELADFEKMPDGPKLSVEDLIRDGFESHPRAFSCLMALRAPGGSDSGSAGIAAGYALYFPKYSTWQGRAILLEDLYVRPAERGKGVGERLFNQVAYEAWSCGARRVDFQVLAWNPARQFYESRGAVDLTSTERWCCYRLSGDCLRAVAAKGVDLSRMGRADHGEPTRVAHNVHMLCHDRHGHISSEGCTHDGETDEN